MATNTANVKQWLDQSEIDYFTHFVKAWIPFNAWYRHAYGVDEQEREILEKIKTDGNKIRTRFMANLEGTDPNAIELRSHIAALHRRLSADPLIDNKNRRISFENVCVGTNPKTNETFLANGRKYTAERKKKPLVQVDCEVFNKKGVVIKTITQPGAWDWEAFQIHPDFMALEVNDRPRMLECYKQVNPYRFQSLLAAPSDKTPLMMDTYKFADDPAAIFAGLIDVIYGMRNLLFHGVLVPDSQANRTYEPAYHLLRHLTASIV